MITSEIVDGQEVLVHYLTADMQPTTPEAAELIQVHYPDGSTMWAYPDKDQ